MVVNVTTDTPVTATSEVTWNYGASWGPWTSSTQRTRFRHYKTDSVSTLKNQSGSYEYPTPYQRYTFAVSGKPSKTRVGIDDWPYNGEYEQHQIRWSTPVVSNIWIGPHGNGLELYGVDPVYLVPAVPASISSRCRSRLIGKIRAHDWDAGTTIGELKNTVRELNLKAAKARNQLKIANRLLPSASLRSRSVRQLRRIGTTASISYLQFIFGILPLMRDIYGLIDTLENGLTAARLRVTVDQKDTTFSLPVPTTSAGWIRTYAGVAKRGIKESATLSLENPMLFNAWRLGLTNPLSVAWEVLSFSFVIDWFLHVGDFVQGLQQPLGVNYLHGYSTKYVDCSFDAIGHRYGGVHDKMLENDPLVVRVYSKGFKREVLLGVVPPIPFVDLGMNFSQVLTLGALALTML